MPLTLWVSGLATTLVLTLTNLTISTLRHWTPAEIRIPIYVMIHRLGGQRCTMLINAYAFGLYQSLGIFIPLIVTNCIVVGRAEAFAAKKVRRFRHWTAFQLVWAQPAPCSCWVHYAKLSAMAHCLTVQMRCLGSWAKVLRVEIFHTDSPFLLAMLPPGAFIGLGLMLAGKYLIDERMKKRRAEAAAERALPNGETGNV
ncbi:Rnf-Nqr domain containing protein [Escherichia coli]